MPLKSFVSTREDRLGKKGEWSRGRNVEGHSFKRIAVGHKLLNFFLKKQNRIVDAAGEGAGVWMAGQGAVADAQANLYVLTGNGDFDGVSQ